MTDAILYRGPDASGEYIDQREDYTIGLGHRRLSIIDLSPLGNQPMQAADGRYHIVFNGEIYNYQEIRRELMDAGYRFRSHSDTEVIILAFDKWGRDAVHRFIGMYAFVLYDAREQKVYGCRDRAGVKPFFYSWREGVLLFGSELKALIPHPAFRRDLDLASIGSYVQLGYIPAPQTIYHGVCKLPPGYHLILDLRSQEMTLEKYWDPWTYFNQPKLDISFEDAKDETEKILKKAFEYRMVADVPVGLFLSGGYDSTCLAALLQKDRTQRLRTFTIGMTDNKLDEAPFARETARMLGTDHEEVYCTEKEAFEILPSLPHFYDEPFADSSAIPTILVSRIARQKVTVALSADAGDELFGGYDRYSVMLGYENRLRKAPGIIRNLTGGLMDLVPVSYIPGLRSNYLFRYRYQKIASLLSDNSIENIYWNNSLYYSDRESKRLMYQYKTNEYDRPTEYRKIPVSVDLLSFACATDYKSYLADDILQKVDRATMSVSLEGREPFLDQHIIEWVARLPSGFKIHGGNKKYILKEIVHRYVGAEYMNRPKMGFSIPVKKWLETSLRPMVKKYFDREFIRKQGIFDSNYLDSMQAAFYKGREQKEKIWAILMFQMWYEKWIG